MEGDAVLVAAVGNLKKDRKLLPLDFVLSQESAWKLRVIESERPGWCVNRMMEGISRYERECKYG